MKIFPNASVVSFDMRQSLTNTNAHPQDSIAVSVIVAPKTPIEWENTSFCINVCHVNSIRNSKRNMTIQNVTIVLTYI